MAFLIPLAATAAAGAGAAAATTGTLATIGMAASLVGAGVTAFGALKSAKAQSNAAKYNAGMAENNAKLQEKNAELAGAQGEVNAANSEMKTRAQSAGILANQGASGVDVNSGSAVDVRSGAAETGELNAINIRADAARQAYGYKTEAAGDMAQSQLDKSAAKQDQAAGYIDAGSTLLGGIGTASTNYANYLHSGGL